MSKKKSESEMDKPVDESMELEEPTKGKEKPVLTEEAKKQATKVAGDYLATCQQWKAFTDSPRWAEIVKELSEELEKATFNLKNPEASTLELRQAQMSVLNYTKVMEIPKSCVDEFNLYLQSNPLFSGVPIGTVSWDDKTKRVMIDMGKKQ